MNFTIYNTSNGKIFSSGYAPDISIQVVPDGHALIEAKSEPGKDYVVNGNVISLPEKPSDFYSFDYNTKQWVPDPTEADNAARMQRNSLLQASDWTQLPDVPLETKQAWATYRQALRDITTQEGYPFNVIWPTKPQ